MLTASNIDVTVRPATTGDAGLLSQLDVTTWASGHDGALPEGLLASIATSPYHDVSFWQTRLDDRSRLHWVWLIEAPRPVGYITFGANTEPDWPSYLGEQTAFVWNGEPVHEYVYGYDGDEQPR